MKYGKLLGWGIVIYSVVFLVWNGLLTYGIVDGYVPVILNLAALLAVALEAGLALRLPRWSDILPYSIGWTVIVAVLDGVFAVPFSGWQIYLDWHVLLGYALVAIVPLFAPQFTSWRRQSGAL